MADVSGDAVKLRFGTPLRIPTDWYRFLGAKFEKPVDCGVPEVGDLVIAQAKTGYPVSVIREDQEYLKFCFESGRERRKSPEGANSVLEAGWQLRGGQSPTHFNLNVLRKNLEKLKQPCSLGFKEEVFYGAFEIMYEELCDKGCSGFKELTEYEALYGLADGSLNPTNMKTSVGACMKMGESKEVARENNPGLYLEIQRDDYDAIDERDREALAWISKTSLKDARLDDVKLAEGKGRIFQAQNYAVSFTGRKLIGGFIGKFMDACKRGGFFGVIGFVLSRGGWHELLAELTNDWEEDRMITYPGDVSKYDKDWLYHWHMVLLWLLALLCGDAELTRKMTKHYDRVLHSPTMLAIVGLIIMLSKGQPSGDVATIVFNTIILTFNYVMAYCMVAPKECWNARECFGNMILRAGGDDSITTLSSQMRAWLGRGGTWPDVVRQIFSSSGWTIVLEEKSLIDAEFMGYGSTLADDPETGLMFLPALPLNATMSIDQWYKFKKKSELPEMVKFIARYSAGAEKAFPHMWSRDPDARDYVKIAFGMLRRVRLQYWDDPCPEIRKAARGVPSIAALAELYFGYPIPLSYLDGKY